jgi:hypothetical protein
VYWHILFALPSGLTPVGIPISGNLAIIDDVNDVADNPGLSIISHNSNTGGIGVMGGLNVFSAAFIDSAIFSIHPI